MATSPPSPGDGGRPNVDASCICDASANEAADALARTPFSQMLTETTMRAPELLAEQLVEKLQQGCLEEARLGHSHFDWDVPLQGSRHFSDQVAKSFAHQLKQIGFERLEWWNGKEWKVPYSKLHDRMYDKFHMRVRVAWKDKMDMVYLRKSFHVPLVGSNAVEAQPELTEAALAPILRQVQQVISLEQELLLTSAKAQADAEERAELAETRASAAERLCLEKLRHYAPDIDHNFLSKVDQSSGAASVEDDDGEREEGRELARFELCGL